MLHTLLDPDPTYALAHSLMTRVTASAHQSEKGVLLGVSLSGPRFTDGKSMFLYETRAPSSIDCHPKREAQGREGMARVCRPNVFAATDVSIPNFHLAFPPSLSPSPFLGGLPLQLPFPSFLPSPPRPEWMSRRSNYSPSSLISASVASVGRGGRGEGGSATAVTVVIWSQSRLLLSTSKVGGGGSGVCDQVSTPSRRRGTHAHARETRAWEGRNRGGEEQQSYSA